MTMTMGQRTFSTMFPPDSWQVAASEALQDLWFGGVVVAEPRAHWLADVEDALPSLRELDAINTTVGVPNGEDAWTESPALDARSAFQFIGALAIANSHLMFGNVLDTVIGKQRDYGHGNILKYGLTGITIRLSDKIERLKNLGAKLAAVVPGQAMPSPINESVADTQLDIVGYALISLMVLDGTFTRELA